MEPIARFKRAEPSQNLKKHGIDHPEPADNGRKRTQNGAPLAQLSD